MFKKVVDKIQDQNDSNCVNRLYGADVSLRGWDLERKRKSFETVEDAHKRSAYENTKIASGKKKKKDHTGNFAFYDIQKSELESYASTWNSETKVIWKQVGEKFVKEENMPPSNSGQIAKHYLLDLEAEGTLDLNYKDKDKQSKKVVRRSLKKVGLKVSVPAELSASQVRKKLHQQILSGEIDIDKGIVEKEYQKVAISKTGELTIKTFKVEGRKHPLSSIRKKRFLKYSKFMRLNNNSYFRKFRKRTFSVCRLKSIGELNCNETADDMREKIKQFERTRHLQVWHDASDIANHGHILFCINVLYDPAGFFYDKRV